MLDISIPKVAKVVTSAASAEEFCNQYVRIVEKLDGTKLTFIRNGEPFDADNYLNNWIVSYKEGIVFPEEFSGLVGRGREEEIRKKSAGRSQYAFVHEHLAQVHKNTADFPKDYEFFVEFIQRKPTISRSYEKTGGLYLTGFGPTVFSLKGARVTSLAEFENDSEKFEYFRNALDLAPYPVLFEGRLDSADSLVEGSADPNIASKFENMRQELEDLIAVRSWKAVLSRIIDVFSDFTSSLGGDAEGVVISPLADPDTGQTTRYTDKLFKTSRADQHDQEMRKIKKQQEFGEGTKEQEVSYFDNLSNFVKSQISNDDLDNESLTSILSKISEIVYSMSRADFEKIGVDNVRKDLIVIQDDAISVARNIVGKRIAAGVRDSESSVSIGVVPMAVKPLHKGHWAIIEKAASENDKVFLIVSAKSRESGGIEISGSDMIKIWKRYLEPILPQNVDISYSGEPVGDTRGVIRLYTNDPEVSFKLYAGEDDKDRFDPASLEKYYPAQYAAGRIEPVFVKNVLLPDGGRISGTYMRGLLAQGKREEFESLLPDNLEDEAKGAIWEMLYKKEAIKESSIRYFIRESLRFV